MSQHRKDFIKRQSDKKWFVRIGHLWGLQVGGQGGAVPWKLTGLQFIIKGKMGRGRRTSLTFLSRRPVFIISSSSRLSTGVFPSASSWVHKWLFFMCAESMSSGSLNCWAHWAGCGLMPPLFHCLGACLVLLLHGFVAKRACLVFVVKQTCFLE